MADAVESWWERRANAQNAWTCLGCGVSEGYLHAEKCPALTQDYANPLAGRNNNRAREMTPEDIGLRGYSFWLGADHG